MVSLAVIILYYVGMILVVALSLFGKINWGLLFLVPLLPLRNVVERFHEFPFGKDMINIILAAMLIGWYFKRREEVKFEYTPLNSFLIVFVIYTFISLCLGSFYLHIPLPFNLEDIRLQNWKNYITFPLLFFITLNNVKTVKDMQILIFVMALSVLLMDYYTLNQIRWMSGLLSRAKINGTFVYLGPNELAAFFGSYVFVFYSIIRSNKLFGKVLYLVVTILSLACVLFLYSRGAYLAIIVVILIYAVSKKRILLIPIIALLLFWQSVLPQNVINRINETGSEQGELDVSSQTRLDLWKVSLDLFYSNPLTGIGYNVIGFLNLPGGLHDTHNVYMKILAEQGIIGIILILMLFRYALMYGWSLYKEADEEFLKGLGFGFVLCVVSLMVSNIFGDRWTHMEVGAYFWVFLALVVRGNLITRENNIENENTALN